MATRRDFLNHRRRTVDSFQLVRSDITGISSSIENVKNMLASMELRLSKLGDEHLGFRTGIADRLSNIEAIQGIIKDFEPKINSMDKSSEDTSNKFNSLKNDLDNAVYAHQDVSRDLSRNSAAIKKILPILKSQTMKSRKLGSVVRKSQEQVDKLKKRLLKTSKHGSALRESQEEIKKLKNLLNRKMRTMKRVDAELEAKIDIQRKRSVELNRKMDARKIIKKTPAIKKVASTKITKTTTVKPVRKIKKTSKIKPVRKVTKKIQKPIKKDASLDKRLVTSIKKTIEPNKETIVEVKEEELKKFL